MCKECEVKQYVSFDELPQELKDKFKYEGRNVSQAKCGFLNFINLLIKNDDELVGDYETSAISTKIKFKKCKHICTIKPNSYCNGSHCGVCHGLQVVKGINDVATTRPDVVRYFINIEDAYKYTKYSQTKVMMKCTECGYEKLMPIQYLTKYGFGCNRCGDGISYPEKVMMNVTNIIDIRVVVAPMNKNMKMIW